MMNIMQKDLDKSYVVVRVTFIIVMSLIVIPLAVILNMSWIQGMPVHGRVMNYLSLITFDFIPFITISQSAKILVILLLTYDEERVFASAREQIAAEQKSTMRRTANIMRYIMEKSRRRNSET